jgi:hypothetical protein
MLSQIIFVNTCHITNWALFPVDMFSDMLFEQIVSCKLFIAMRALKAKILHVAACSSTMVDEFCDRGEESATIRASNELFLRMMSNVLA